MNETLQRNVRSTLDEIRKQGLYKTERVIESPQGVEITTNGNSVPSE